MKKAFIQLGSWILKHKKKLIYGALALFIGQICFFNLGGIGICGGNEVFAQGQDTATQSANLRDKATSWLTTLSFLQKVIYVFMYPILGIAGKLVDNSLVYGEVFGFDTVLRKLRNIVRNLANFGLGFIFIYEIFKILIKENKELENVKGLIGKSLIAGIGIQASWFIMAALIDISSILAYGVGGLPLSVLEGKETTTDYNPYVVPSAISIDAGDMDSSQVYLSNMPLLGSGTSEFKFISECETIHYKPTSSGEVEEEVILAPKTIYYLDGNGEFYPSDNLKCHIGDQIYFFKGLCNGLSRSSSSGTGWKEEQKEYNKKLISLRTQIEGDPSIAEGCLSSYAMLKIGETNTGNKAGLDKNNEWIGEEWGGTGTMMRLNQIMSGDGYVGVFTALYSSLINVGADLRLTPTDDNGVYASVLNVVLSFAHMIAIAIPLIAMAVVFIMRIAVLWMGISLSPLIVLLTAFGFDKKIDNKILSYIKVENLIPIIFSPAIICFAISMSTVLVKIINNMNKETIKTLETPILGGLVQLNIAGMGVAIGKMVCSIICIAITRFLVWAAVKSTKLGESGIIKGIENLAKDSLGSIPIIPVPGKNGKGVEYMGVGTVFGRDGDGGIISKMADDMKREYSSKERETIDNWLNKGKAEAEANVNKGNAYWEGMKTFSAEQINGNWMSIPIVIGEKNKEQMTFNKLSDEQKEKIIENINGLDTALRNAYGQATEEIKIGSKTYKYVPKTDKDGNVEKDKDGNELKEFKEQ